jgi:hypothetical protein
MSLYKSYEHTQKMLEVLDNEEFILLSLTDVEIASPRSLAISAERLIHSATKSLAQAHISLHQRTYH